MKYGIIADIHSNIHALRKALKELEPEVDEIICVGDVVGYNAKPSECIKAVQNNKKITRVVQGNHDLDSADFAVLSMGRIRELSGDAYAGIKYSSSKLSDKEREWLRDLPREWNINDDDTPFWVSHYSPEICTPWGYILSLYDAQDSFDVFEKWGGGNIFFFGHSHVPSFIEKNSEGKISYHVGEDVLNKPYELKPSSHYLINPGAIGQPRVKGITSYIIFDTKEKNLVVKPFEYNVKAAQKAIIEASYSQTIAQRLDFDAEGRKKRAKKERCKQRQKQLDAQKRQ